MKTRIKVAALFTLVCMLFAPAVASASGLDWRMLSELSPGDVVYDDSWQWEFRTGNDYTGTGEIKPVKWIVIDMDHMDYPLPSVTLLSQEVLALNNYSSTWSQDWDNTSDSLRDFLNGTFYDQLSVPFRGLVMKTALPCRHGDGSYYTTEDWVFVLSGTELGGGPSWAYDDIGSVMAYFGTDTLARRYATGVAGSYWTRTPMIGASGPNILVHNNTPPEWYTEQWDSPWATDCSFGVRPAVNLEAQTMVVQQLDGSYRILWDQTPPVTTASVSGIAGTGGWYVSDVQVALNADDSESGVSLTFYSLDGVEFIMYPDWPFPITSEGTTTLQFYSFDEQTNREEINELAINIDKTSPVISINSAPGQYYSDEDFIVVYDAVDGTSGVASSAATLDGVPVANGQAVDLTAMSGTRTLAVSAVDAAGNSASASMTFEVAIRTIPCALNIDPDSLNLASRSDKNAVTAYIELPTGYDVNLVDVGSVTLWIGDKAIPAEIRPTDVGDKDGDGIMERMVKFGRQAVIGAMDGPGEYALQVTGNLTSGLEFSGSDTIGAFSNKK